MATSTNKHRLTDRFWCAAKVSFNWLGEEGANILTIGHPSASEPRSSHCAKEDPTPSAIFGEKTATTTHSLISAEQLAYSIRTDYKARNSSNDRAAPVGRRQMEAKKESERPDSNDHTKRGCARQIF